MLALFRGLQRGSQALRPELQELVRGSASAAAAGAASPAAASKPVVEKEFLVYRWNPDSAEAPKYDSYKIDINA